MNVYHVFKDIIQTKNNAQNVMLNVLLVQQHHIIVMNVHYIILKKMEIVSNVAYFVGLVKRIMKIAHLVLIVLIQRIINVSIVQIKFNLVFNVIIHLLVLNVKMNIIQRMQNVMIVLFHVVNAFLIIIVQSARQMHIVLLKVNVLSVLKNVKVLVK